MQPEVDERRGPPALEARQDLISAGYGIMFTGVSVNSGARRTVRPAVATGYTT
jgi:hypothetical protein